MTDGRPLSSTLRRRVRRVFELLLAHHVWSVLTVFLADAFDEFGIAAEIPGHLEVPRFGIRLWIIDGHIDIHDTVVGTRVPFRHVQRFGSRKTSHIEPR